MPDNIIYTSSGTGGVPNATSVRTRQLSGGQHVQGVDVAPFQASAVSGGQYALSVGSSSPTTLTVPSGATHAWISVDSTSNSIRWTRDGTSPTTSVGHMLQATEAMEIDSLSNFRMISTSGTATVQVSYHRYV